LLTKRLWSVAGRDPWSYDGGQDAAGIWAEQETDVLVSKDQRITIEPGKRGGKPCIRGLRITVYDVLSQLASGSSVEEVLADFPDLQREDIRASLRWAADRERGTVTTSA